MLRHAFHSMLSVLGPQTPQTHKSHSRESTECGWRLLSTSVGWRDEERPLTAKQPAITGISPGVLHNTFLIDMMTIINDEMNQRSCPSASGQCAIREPIPRRTAGDAAGRGHSQRHSNSNGCLSPSQVTPSALQNNRLTRVGVLGSLPRIMHFYS